MPAAERGGAVGGGGAEGDGMEVDGAEGGDGPAHNGAHDGGLTRTRLAVGESAFAGGTRHLLAIEAVPAGGVVRAAEGRCDGRRAS